MIGEAEAERSSGEDRPRASTAAPEAQPAVRVTGLEKRFPVRSSLRETLRAPFRRETLEVLYDVTFEVRAGELFGLLGPNGAGKTTLLKILTTLIVPDGGVVRVAGRDPVRTPAAVREVLTPVIADERSLDWRLSGPANLRLFAALYGVPAAERAPLVERLIRTVGLEDAGDRMVGQYSSGMRQRLLIARALVSEPRVMLLDEPTRSLDPVSARNLRRMLRDVVIERLGCAVILATHNPEEAFDLCDRLAVLDRGRIMAIGSPQELVHLAEQERCRIVVPDAQEELARSRLPEASRASFRSQAVPVEGWVALEGDLPGGIAAVSAVVRELSTAGVELAEVTRPPLALADLIERLIRRSAA